ncbi:hypothetical protein VSR34_01175 [Paraburkholderia sp. JHI2823]
MSFIKYAAASTLAMALVFALLALQATLDERGADPLVVCHVRSCT